MLSLANDLKYALDPVRFFREPLALEPDPWQVEALGGNWQRLLLNIHRQGGKSTVAAALAVHEGVYKPGSLTLIVSPSLRQSSELFRTIGGMMDKIGVKAKLLEDNKLSCTLPNRSRIVSLPSSEATIRGFSKVSLLIEDEAARVADSLYFAVRPMLAISDGRLLLMSTPFGKRGHFFEEWQSASAWQRIEVSAIDCPRISAAFLDQERASLGDWWFEQEYLCQFKEAVDSLFTYESIMAAMADDIQPIVLEGALEQWQSQTTTGGRSSGMQTAASASSSNIILA